MSRARGAGSESRRPAFHDLRQKLSAGARENERPREDGPVRAP
jgi:hypothetical protein